MTVAPQTYTAAATWTASQLADIFKQALIDAGLMTDWFDSFLNTVESRVLRVINDGSKTYGTVYYWFMFTTNGVFVQTTSTWNAATHVPTGTQYIDYLSAVTSVTTNHATLLSLSNTTNCALTRYTSGVNSAVSLFLIRNGSSNTVFMVSNPSFNASAFVDQNKVQFNNLLTVGTSTTGNASTVVASQVFHTRASYLGAVGLRGITTASQYASLRPIQQFTAPGNAIGSSTNYSSSVNSVWLPIAENNTNTALAADHMPVFTAPTISPYMAALPSDFGIVGYYASNTMAVQDTLVVSSGTEEWEMLAVGLNATTDAARIMFCARTV
jgi:hypothetical protein